MRNNNMILLFNNSFFRKLMLLTLVVGQLFGQNSDSVKIDGPMPTIADSLAADTMVVHKLDRVVKNRAFSVGEKLTFNIRYGIIKAGEATMAVAEQLPINESHEAYRIVSTARSASFFDNFYKVRDSVETFLDTRGLFSWRFEKRLHEGGYKFDLLVDYNQRMGKAEIQRIRYHGDEPLRIKNQSSFDLDMPAYVLDVLGSFYFVRTQRLEPGMPLYMINHDNKKIYDLQVFVQKRERISVDAGSFNCILVKPVLLGESIFKQDGEMWIWLTDDQYKIPVQMKSKVAVGSITTELKKIEGVPLPLPSQIR